jgi:hypothetical protein
MSAPLQKVEAGYGAASAALCKELRSATRSSSAKRRILEFWSSARKEVLWFAMAAGKNGV